MHNHVKKWQHVEYFACMFPGAYVEEIFNIPICDCWSVSTTNHIPPQRVIDSQLKEKKQKFRLKKTIELAKSSKRKFQQKINQKVNEKS